MFRSGLLMVVVLVLLSPGVLGYGVPREPLGQQQKTPIILFPSEPQETIPPKLISCPPEQLVEVTVTETELVPTYHTTTATEYITSTLDNYHTETLYQTTTLVQPSYVTETQYQTEYQTEYATEYLTETQHHTQTVSTTEIDYQTIYSTVVEPTYVTEIAYQTEYLTDFVTEYLTATERLTSTQYHTETEVQVSSVYVTNVDTVTVTEPHYVTTTAQVEVERLVSIPCVPTQVKGGYGR
ncbi:hypothetical protein Pcinc_039803 [Petrolisthes cinctipes]|uniref:Uncharacterized protein n=1 Tax=Petrolisthes cinctipes TaxID=88211 RepID=A0AAE1EIQ7_PETCI|nr:hypothetical protein Pcinc_039803 [Petrolisthes cinctipes]